MSKRVHAQYTPEFRRDAVQVYASGKRSIMTLAKDLGVNRWTLRGWCREQDMVKKRESKTTRKPKRAPGPGQAPKQETPAEAIRRLEREKTALERKVAQLEMDREILKKAAAFFAKEKE